MTTQGLLDSFPAGPPHRGLPFFGLKIIMHALSVTRFAVMIKTVGVCGVLRKLFDVPCPFAT